MSCSGLNIEIIVIFEIFWGGELATLPTFVDWELFKVKGQTAHQRESSALELRQVDQRDRQY